MSSLNPLCLLYICILAFLLLTLICLLTLLFNFVFCFLFFYSPSIRRMRLPLVPYYLISPNLRYNSFLPFSSTLPLPHTFSCVPSLFFLSSSYGFLCSSFFLVTFIFQDKPKPISIYHPTAEELSASIGTPMGGFFEGANVMFGTTASATPATA